MVIGGTAHKRRHDSNMVSDLETDSAREELLGGLLIQRSHHHMAEPTRAHLVGALDRRGPAVRTACATRPVGRLLLGGRHNNARRDLYRYSQCGVRIVYHQLLAATKGLGA